MSAKSIPKGFTLLELMIALSLAAILVSIAMPGYQTLMARTQLSARANELLASLHYTRSEAVKRGMRVTICKSVDGGSCIDTGDWQDGWLIFSDGGKAGTIDGGDQVLRVFTGLHGMTLKADNQFKNWISFLPNGRSRGSGNLPNGSFYLCHAEQGRRIIINHSGRPRVDVAAFSC